MSVGGRPKHNWPQFGISDGRETLAFRSTNANHADREDASEQPRLTGNS